MQKLIPTIQSSINIKLQLGSSHDMTRHALLLATLAEGVSELSNMNSRQSVQTLLAAINQLGIVTQYDESTGSCIIAGCNGIFPKKQTTIWCDESILTARFLIAACTATPGVFYFDGGPKLRKRSIKHLLNIICRQGSQLIPSDATQFPFTLVGADSLEGGEITINPKTPKQILAALLMMAPFARSPCTFKLNDTINPYIEMTIALMAEFGVLVHRIHPTQLMVPVPQRYHARDYALEPDLSIAIYFFAAAAITNSELIIHPIKRLQCKQTQIQFLSVLEKMGCRILETHQGLIVRGNSDLQGLDVSIREYSDNFLALAAIAPFAKSPTRITLINSDVKNDIRMLAIRNAFVNMGIHIEHGEDWIKIFPSKPEGVLVNTYQDPKLAMAFTIIGLKAPGVILDDDTSVNLFYPEFLPLISRLTEEANINA